MLGSLVTKDKGHNLQAALICDEYDSVPIKLTEKKPIHGNRVVIVDREKVILSVSFVLFLSEMGENILEFPEDDIASLCGLHEMSVLGIYAERKGCITCDDGRF